MFKVIYLSIIPHLYLLNKIHTFHLNVNSRNLLKFVVNVAMVEPTLNQI